MRDGPWKIISGTKELFNLDNDMEEFNNLWDSEPEIRDRMMAMLTERVIRKLYFYFKIFLPSELNLYNTF